MARAGGRSASHSTPEADTVAAADGLRREGLPAIDLRDVIHPRPAPPVFHEDTGPLIRVCRSGRNPTMRHLWQSQSVSADLCCADLDLVNEQSERQPAGM